MKCPYHWRRMKELYRSEDPVETEDKVLISKLYLYQCESCKPEEVAVKGDFAVINFNGLGVPLAVPSKDFIHLNKIHQGKLKMYMSISARRVEMKYLTKPVEGKFYQVADGIGFEVISHNHGIADIIEYNRDIYRNEQERAIEELESKGIQVRRVNEVLEDLLEKEGVKSVKE